MMSNAERRRQAERVNRQLTRKEQEQTRRVVYSSQGVLEHQESRVVYQACNASGSGRRIIRKMIGGN